MITIFTCTYNREAYLVNLYHSLQKQDNKDFEWLVIDDGSTDSTQVFISEIIEQETEFNIIYEKFPNGGKHRAINRGMPYVNGEYVFLVDSDDELTEDAVHNIQSWISTIKGNKGLAGVAGLRAFRNGKIIGGVPKIKNDYIDASNVERRKYRLLNDKAEIYRTDILKKYPFPEFEGEKFLAEGIVWNRIAKEGYQLRWFPKVIYLCDYLEGGLTRDSNKIVNNWEGFLCSTKEALELYKGYERERIIIRFVYYACIKGMLRKEIYGELEISNLEYYFTKILAMVYPIVRKGKIK